MGSTMRAPRVCFVITEDWYFWSHRRLLAQSLIDQGCRVDLVTNLRNMKSRIEAMGVLPHSVGLQRTGRNPMGEAMSVHRMAVLFRQLKPDVVHLVGMKPILYGSMAARIAGVPSTVCAIAGLGWLFTPGGILKTAARHTVQMYFRMMLAKRNNIRFIVQNKDHRDVLVSSGMSATDQVEVISGAGVDTNRFRYNSEPKGCPTILTHGRMLWDKGIGELVKAARVIKRHKIDCRFMLVGDPDPANPESISKAQLDLWNEEGVVHWQPRRDDIPKLLAESHIACLPSYHEGFPLSLAEASAVGRPIVTTDISGCRDVVEDGKTGLLVPKQSIDELAQALAQLILSSETRQEMGRCGRQRVVETMSSEIVNRQTYECYQRVLRASGIDVGDTSSSPTRTVEARRAA